jgi:hypothetical protein
MTTNHPTPAENGPAGESAENTKTCQNQPLRVRQESVALLIATGHSVQLSASRSGASERSVYRWLREDQSFIRRVREHRSDILAQAVGKLASLGGRAVDELGRLLDNESATLRLKTVAVILGNLVPGFKVLEERQACELAEKALSLGQTVDAQRRQLDDERRRLDDERRRLDDERRRLGGNGAGGPYGYGR